MNVRRVKTVSLPLLFPFCLSFPSCHRLPPNSSSPPTAQISLPVFGVDPDLPWSACSSQHPEMRSITGPAATRKHTIGINPGLTACFVFLKWGLFAANGKELWCMLFVLIRSVGHQGRHDGISVAASVAFEAEAFLVHRTNEKPAFAVLLAQQAAHQSHNLRVVSSNLTQGNLLFQLAHVWEHVQPNSVSNS